MVAKAAEAGGADAIVLETFNELAEVELALGGGGLGVVFAHLATRFTALRFAELVPRGGGLGLDARMLVAAVVISMTVGLAAGIIVVGWLVYDLLCRSPLRNNERLLSAVLFLLVSVLAWGLCELFSGRGAYIHFGAVLGTIMVANVFFVIIPGQKRMVAAAERGAVPDAEDGIRAKQRSVHNTYFTLPVLFVMTSNHYAMTYSHEYNWAILVAISLAGALIRVYFVARHSGKASPLPLVIAGLLLAGVAALIAPRASAASGEAVAFEDVQAVVAHRCMTCHSAQPTHPAFPAAPGGVVLDTEEQIVAEALRIHQQTVVTRVMPIDCICSTTISFAFFLSK